MVGLQKDNLIVTMIEFRQKSKTPSSASYVIVDPEIKEGQALITEASVEYCGMSCPLTRRVMNCFGINKPVLYFHSFGTVNREMRHKGYGRKMLQNIKEIYKGYIIYLAVSASGGGPLNDKQLVKFYESEGFITLKNVLRGGYLIMAIEL